jgi:hypothetical protein
MRQTSVALSSTESEYIAMTLAAQEAVWLHLLLSELAVLDGVSCDYRLCQGRKSHFCGEVDVS